MKAMVKNPETVEPETENHADFEALKGQGACARPNTPCQKSLCRAVSGPGDAQHPADCLPAFRQIPQSKVNAAPQWKH